MFCDKSESAGFRVVSSLRVQGSDFWCGSAFGGYFGFRVSGLSLEGVLG